MTPPTSDHMLAEVKAVNDDLEWTVVENLRFMQFLNIPGTSLSLGIGQAVKLEGSGKGASQHFRFEFLGPL